MYRTGKQANQTTSTLEYKDLIVFLVGFLSEESGFLELVLKRVHTLLISQGPVFQHLAGAASNHNFSTRIWYESFEILSNGTKIRVQGWPVRRHARKHAKEHTKLQVSSGTLWRKSIETSSTYILTAKSKDRMTRTT